LQSVGLFHQHLLYVEPRDELPCLKIPKYTLEKYCLYRIVFNEWIKFMDEKARWKGYVDLTAGPGYSELKDMPPELTSKQIAASPIIALKTKPEFSYMIFVERDPENCRALANRVGRIRANGSFHIRQSDANAYATHALRYLKGPCLVCVDPYDPMDVKRTTVETVLKNSLCDLVGLLPAPEIQRVVGAYGDRLFIEGLHEHMPLDFDFEEAKKKGILKYARECYREWVMSFGRSTCCHYIPKARYQIIFASTSPDLSTRVHKKIKSHVI
jgi:three-Cys-motif partner protein